jgi:hypothetical protein
MTEPQAVLHVSVRLRYAQCGHPRHQAATRGSLAFQVTGELAVKVRERKINNNERRPADGSSRNSARPAEIFRSSKSASFARNMAQEFT